MRFSLRQKGVKKEGRRGQITLFIILGLVLLLVVGLGLYFTFSVREEVLSQEASEAIERAISLYPPERFMEYCVQYHMPTLLASMGHQGGTLFPQDYESVWSNNKQVRIWYLQESGNLVVSRPLIAQELRDSLWPLVERCFDTRVYQQQGFSVTRGELSITDVSLGPHTVTVRITLPLTLINEDQEIRVENFAIEYPTPFGMLVDEANTFVNSFSRGEMPDVVAYSIGSNLTVRASRDSPYPHEIYTINNTQEDLSLTFAIEGVDPFRETSPPPNGCCTIDQSCFASSSQSLCQQREGFYRNVCSCEGVDYRDAQTNYALAATGYDLSCPNGDCEDCSTALHGESWCAQVPGVGGRFFRQSCLDGEIVTEYCKDYRQELCVQTTLDNPGRYEGFRVAHCRQNSYGTCQDCTDESCCNERDERDCIWIDKVGCRPAVAPGLPFWRDEARVQCSQASIICEDCEINQQDMLFSCVQAGDCGNQLNVYGEVGAQSMVSLQSYAHDDYTSTLGVVDDLAYDIQAPSNVLFSGTAQVLSMSKLVAAAFDMIERLSSVSLIDYLNPAKDISLSNGLSYCGAWQPPDDDACSYCMQADIPCSEYLCRSLGDNCFFRAVNGSGICAPLQPSESVPPRVTNIDSPIGIESAQLGDINGYKVGQEVSSQQPLQATLTMSEPARCKISYLPGKSFDTIGGLELSNAQFSTQQELQLRLVSNMDVLERMITLFNSSDYRELANKMVTFKSQLELMARKYPHVSRFSGGYYPIIKPLVEQYVQEETHETIGLLLDELDEGRYYLFLRCIDESGNENEETFLRFQIANICADERAPEGISAVRNGQAIEIVLDELSQCRLGSPGMTFDEMNATFMCPSSIYDIDADGNYRCTANLPESIGDEIDVICRDHPEWELKPFSRNIEISEQVNASRLIDVAVESSNTSSISLSISDKGAQVTFALEGTYTCSIDNTTLACGTDSCLWNAQVGATSIVCTPESFCGRSPNEGRIDLQEIGTSLAGNMTAAYDPTNGLVEVLSDDAQSCEIFVDSRTYPLTQTSDGDGRFAAIIDMPAGSYRAQARCTIDGQMVAHEFRMLK